MSLTIKCVTSLIFLEFLVDMRLNPTQESRKFWRVVFIQLNIFLNLIICLHLQQTIGLTFYILKVLQQM